MLCTGGVRCVRSLSYLPLLLGVMYLLQSCLFRICVGAVRIPCNAVTDPGSSNIVLSNYAVRGDSQVVMEGCHWDGSRIGIYYAQPLRVTFANSTMAHSSFMINLMPGSQGSEAVIVGSTAKECTDFFSVHSDTSVDAFSISVVDSFVGATSSAFHIFAPAISNVSVHIYRSYVKVCGTNAYAVAFTTPTVTFSMSFVTVEVVDSTVSAEASASIAVSVGAIEVVSSDATFSADHVSLHSIRSNVSATTNLENGKVASMSLMLHSIAATALSMSIRDVFFHSYWSNVSAILETSRNYDVASCMGILLLCADGKASATADNVSMLALSSTLKASTAPSGAALILCLGIGMYGAASCSATITDVVLYSQSSVATVVNGWRMACLGVSMSCHPYATECTGSSTVLATRVLMYSQSSNISSFTPYGVAVVSLGLVWSGYNVVGATFENLTLYSTASNVSAGTDSEGDFFGSLASYGVVLFSEQSSELVGAYLTLYSVGSRITAVSRGPLTAVGVSALVSRNGRLTMERLLVVSCASSMVMTTGGVGACFATLPCDDNAQLEHVRWVATSTSISSGHFCFTLPPSTQTGLSVAFMLQLSCDPQYVGWSRAASDFCGAGVTAGTELPKMYNVSGTCPYNTTSSCSSVFDAPHVFIPTVGEEQQHPAELRVRTHSRTRDLTRSHTTETASVVWNSSSRSATTHHHASMSTLTNSVSGTSATQSLSAQAASAPGVADLLGVVGYVVPQDAAFAIVWTGTASAGVVSVLGNPVGAGSAVRAGLVARSVHCLFADGALEPSLLDYPLGHLFLGDAIDMHAAGIAASAILAMLAVVAGNVASVAGWRFPLSLAQAVEATVHQYFGPSVAGGTVLVLRHSTSVAPVVIVLVFAAVECTIVFHRFYVVLYRVKREVVYSKEMSGGTVKCKWEGPLVRRFGAFFDSCRDGDCALVRTVFFVEALFSVAIACVVGWHPLSGTCVASSSVMLCLSLGLLAYLCVWHPYRAKREMGFSLLLGIFQCLQASCALGVTLGWTDGLTPLGVVSLLQMGVLFLQLAVAVFWEVSLQHKRQFVSSEDKASPLLVLHSIAADDGCASKPMNPLHT